MNRPTREEWLFFLEVFLGGVLLVTVVMIWVWLGLLVWHEITGK